MKKAKPAKRATARKAKPSAVPAMNPVLWRVADIIPYHSNPRTHPAEQVTLLAKLMVRHGIDQPIVVDEDGVILKGHGRRLGAIEAGIEEFPVIQRTDLSDVEKRAMRIEDNQVALLSAWDESLIRVEIASLQTAGYEIALLGFGDVDLVSFTTTPGPADEGARGVTIGNLAERFGVVPFSVLNAREGWWQARKRAWLTLGIRSELGRGENLLKFSDSINEPDPKKRAARKRAKATEAAE